MKFTYVVHILTAPGQFRAEKEALQYFFESLNPHMNPDGIKVVVCAEEHPDCDPNHIVVYHPDHTPLVLQAESCAAAPYTPLHYTYDNVTTATFYALLYVRLTILTCLFLDVRGGQYLWGGYPLRSLDAAQPLTHRADDSDEARATILYLCLKEMQGRLTIGVTRTRRVAFQRFLKGSIPAAVASLNRQVRKSSRSEDAVDIRRAIECHYLAALLFACDTNKKTRHIDVLYRIMEVVPHLPHEDAIAAVVDLGRYLHRKEQAEMLLAITDAMHILCKDAWYHFESLHQYARRASKGADYYLVAMRLGSVLWQAQPEKSVSYYMGVCEAYIAFLEQADIVNYRAVEDTMEKMADVYESTSDFDSAIMVRNAIYERCCERFGEVFEDTVNALKQLAMTHYKGGDLETTCHQLEELYTRQCLLYGDEDSQPAVTIAMLSRIYKQRNDPDRALYWLEKLHAHYCANFGADDPRALDVLLIQAEIHRDRGQHDVARALGEKVYTTFRAICGDNHFNTLRALDFLRSLTET